VKKVFIKTYGCAHNQADSESMTGQLVQEGFKIVEDIRKADVVIINTCTVKDPAEKKFFSELSKIKKPVVVAGCIPQADRRNVVVKDYSLIGIKQIDKICEVVSQTLEGNIVHLLDNNGIGAGLDLPRIRRNTIIEIIPISNGCLGYCSFCKTKFARGELASFKEEDIIKRARDALNEGVKEIWLTSEDTGAYGLDIGTSLPKLLKSILLTPKDFKIRIGMINPEHVKNYCDELIQIYKDPRVFKFLHIPVQSGNDRILRLMKRLYTIKEFKNTVKKIKEGVPKITISTDIICGFPSETDEEFEVTLNLVRELKFPVINISKFYARRGTIAAKMKPLNSMTVKERSKVLSILFTKVSEHKKWVGWRGTVLINERGKNGTFIGRNDFYKPVIVKGKNILGKKLDVEVVRSNRDYLEGKNQKDFYEPKKEY